MFQVQHSTQTGLMYTSSGSRVHILQVCLNLYLANGETAFRTGGLNNLAVYKPRYGLCRSVMINKRSAISSATMAVLNVPWAMMNPDAYEGQSLHFLFDDDYTVRRTTCWSTVIATEKNTFHAS